MRRLWCMIAAAMLAASVGWVAAAPAQDTAGVEEDDQPVLFPKGRFNPDKSLVYLTVPRAPGGYGTAGIARGGYWASTVDGSRQKVGEWVNLESSGFADVDFLSSDGNSTADGHITMFDDETYDGDLTYYNNGGISVDLEFDKYIHRLGNQPYDNFGDPLAPPDPLHSTTQFVARDLTDNDDFAIRVEEVDAQIKGRLSKNVRWRVDVWEMRKHGTRQVASVQHCYEDSICHAQTQGQAIDWMTTQIKPVIEFELDGLTLEYSRPMRIFTQNDGITTREYDHFQPFQDNPGEYEYAIVPENFTQLDQLKACMPLGDDTSIYGLGTFGNTHNQYRETDRNYWGWDVRMVNHSFTGVTFTVYAKELSRNQSNPEYFLTEQGEPPSAAAELDGTDLRDIHPLWDIDRFSTGAKAAWTPYSNGFTGLRGVTFTSGYEYCQTERENTEYRINASTGTPGSGTPFEIGSTFSNKIYFDARKRWCREFTAYTRYTMEAIENPLVGLRLFDNNYPGSSEFVANTNQPEHIDLVELGAHWTPTSNFLMTGRIGAESRYNRSGEADFDEQNFPVVVTAWYAPTSRWSLSGGAAYLTNYIDQDISIGLRTPAQGNPAFTDRWDYDGDAQIYNIGTSYAATQRLTLKGDVQWIRGSNNVFVPAPEPGIDLTALPGFIDVETETTRLSTGVDYQLSRRFGTYGRYVFYDFDDFTKPYRDGTANMFLAGVSGTF